MTLSPIWNVTEVPSLSRGVIERSEGRRQLQHDHCSRICSTNQSNSQVFTESFVFCSLACARRDLSIGGCPEALRHSGAHPKFLQIQMLYRRLNRG